MAVGHALLQCKHGCPGGQRFTVAVTTPPDASDACCLQIDSGVQGFIIGGTTGEGQLMSWDEHIMLIAHTVNR